MSLTKLSLGGNNDVINKLYPPRESLVSDIPAEDWNIEKLFLRCSDLVCCILFHGYPFFVSAQYSLQIESERKNDFRWKSYTIPDWSSRSLNLMALEKVCVISSDPSPPPPLILSRIKLSGLEGLPGLKTNPPIRAGRSYTVFCFGVKVWKYAY